MTPKQRLSQCHSSLPPVLAPPLGLRPFRNPPIRRSDSRKLRAQLRRMSRAGCHPVGGGLRHAGPGQRPRRGAAGGAFANPNGASLRAGLGFECWRHAQKVAGCGAKRNARIREREVPAPRRGGRSASHGLHSSRVVSGDPPGRGPSLDRVPEVSFVPHCTSGYLLFVPPALQTTDDSA